MPERWRDPLITGTHLVQALCVISTMRSHVGLVGEDFADMLLECLDANCMVSHSGTVPAHNPRVFVDEGIISVGASIYVRISEYRKFVLAYFWTQREWSSYFYNCNRYDRMALSRIK